MHQLKGNRKKKGKEEQVRRFCSRYTETIQEGGSSPFVGLGFFLGKF